MKGCDPEPRWAPLSLAISCYRKGNSDTQVRALQGQELMYKNLSAVPMCLARAKPYIPLLALQRKKTVGAKLGEQPQFGRIEKIPGQSLTLDVLSANSCTWKNRPCDFWHLVVSCTVDSLHCHGRLASPKPSYFSRFCKPVSGRPAVYFLAHLCLSE